MNEPSEAPKPSVNWFADGVLFSTAMMWGINIIVFKGAIGEVNPWVFNGLRLVFAMVTLGILCGLETRFRSQPSLRTVAWRRVFGYCFLSGFLYLVTFVKGIELTTAGNTALILASLPMWTAVLSFLVLHERLPRAAWIGLLLTFVGTIIVTTQTSGPVSLSGQYLLGNAIMLAATIFWAAGTVLSKTVLDSISPLRLAFISSVVTTPVHFAIAMWVARGEPEVWTRIAEPSALAALVYSGVFSTGVAYATWNMGVRAVGGSHASVYQNVVTLVAVVGGWLFLKEQPLAAQILGGCLTISGLILIRRAR